MWVRFSEYTYNIPFTTSYVIACWYEAVSGNFGVLLLPTKVYGGVSTYMCAFRRLALRK